MSPQELKYTKDHEWIQAQGADFKVGVTDFAQSQLGDVVFVELPEVGRQLVQGEPFGVVESVKSVSDLYAPIGGTVRSVNQELLTHPERVNEAPFGDGWMITLSPANVDDIGELLDAEAYDALLAKEQNH